jgi:autophagy-related protein 9
MSEHNINNPLYSLFGQGSLYQSLDTTEQSQQQVSDSLPNRFQTSSSLQQGSSLQLMGSDNDNNDVDESIHLQQISPAPAQCTVRNAVLETAGEEEEEEDVPSSLLFDQPTKSGPSRNFPSKQQRLKSNRSVLFFEPERPKRTTIASGNFLPLPATTGTSRQASKVRKAVQTVFRQNVPDSEGRHNVRTNLGLIDPTQRALWKWANVENLDNFLLEVYNYYLGNGFYCILLSRLLNLVTVMFVVGFSTYLSTCIDYSKIKSSSSLSEVQYPQCMSRLGYFSTFLIWLFTLFWFMKLIQYVYDIQRLLDLKNFYFYLLNISDAEMQTISWQLVVKRLMLLKDKNPTTAATAYHSEQLLGSQSKQRMDPHDIANRIMRKENYLIAMINKDILNLKLPIPFFKEPLLTRTIEWNISLCIMDFVFNESGQVRPIFLKDNQRNTLVEGLRRRFMFAAILNVLCAPFTVVYLTLLYFFRYFNEYHKDPGSIGSRQYTPLAEWKMREFNELYHLFQRRLTLSYEPASNYVNQFPKEKTVILSRFVAFVTGSFAAVLGIVSLVDPELFLGFEITKDKTVLFYIGLFGSILAFSRSMIPNESYVFDPETSARTVIEYTHYLPDDWEGKLHTDEVKNEFSKLYDLKIMVIIRELLSVIITPFLLWLSLRASSDKIVDFFREFTIQVDGLGYVCSFATFDFNNAGKRKSGYKPKRAPFKADEDDKFELRSNYFATTDGKMLKSYLNFLDNYAEDQNTDGNNYGMNSFYGKAAGVRNFGASHHYGNNYNLSSSRMIPGGESANNADFMEHSVMGRFNKVQTQIQNGMNTPLNRSGLLDASLASLDRTGLFNRRRPGHIVPDTIPSEDGTDEEEDNRFRHLNSSNVSGSSNPSNVLEDSFVTDLYSRKRLLSFHHRSDDEEDEDNNGIGGNGEKGGVLGMLGQFYKQTDVTKL